MLLVLAVHESAGFMGIFENNVINWVLLIAVIGYLVSKNVPGMLANRANRIETAISEARTAKQESEAFFNEQKRKIENAEQEAATIISEAKKVAEEIRAQVAREAEQEALDLEKRIEAQIGNERNIAITQLRAQAATGAVRMAEASLPGNLSANAKERLFNDFVDQLDVVRPAVGATK